MVQVKYNNYSEQGTSERLTMHLVEEHSVVDPTYIEDFLLTYRTFLSSPMVVGKKLLEWFHDPSLRDKVCWSNNTIIMGSGRRGCYHAKSPHSRQILGSICLLTFRLLCFPHTCKPFVQRLHSPPAVQNQAGWIETSNCPMIWAGELIVCVPCNWLVTRPINFPASRSVTNETTFRLGTACS